MIAEHLERFRKAAIAKADAVARGTAGRDAELFAEMRSALQSLVGLGPSGIAAFRASLHDPAPEVALWVAGQLLAEGDSVALKVLQSLSQLSGFTGLSAAVTLREHHAGRLAPPFGFRVL